MAAPEGVGFAGLGKPGALALLRLFLVPMIGYLAAPGGSSGMALAFAALLVLTRAQAGHAAGGGLGPVLVDATHQLAGSAWVGGAGAFALAMTSLLRERPSAAGAVGARFGQLALAWLLARGEDIVPIPGTKHRKYLEENVGALNVKLSGADLARIEGVVTKGIAAGARYPEGGMRTVNG